MTPAGLCFLDTNILLYALDPRDPRKQGVAAELIRSASADERAVVSTQVLIELFHNLQRKLGLDRERAARTCFAFTEWPVVASDMSLAMKAMARAAQSQLSIWDAMIVEAALRGGAATLYTEDLTHGQRFGVLAVCNPFEVRPA